MSTVQHTVTHLVVHRLHKTADTPARVDLREAECAPDAAAVRLVERLNTHYASRSGKGFGRFEEDEERFPLAGWLREWRIERATDFLALSRRIAAQVGVIADEEELEEGGYIVLALVREGPTDCLWLAVIGETVGTAVSGGLEPLDCPHLDLAALRGAGRIDLEGWQRGEDRYLGFLRGRGSSGAWFKRLLGCSDVIVALQETKKLVQTLGRFVDEQQLEPAARDAMLERAHTHLDALGESGTPVAFEALAREVCPERPAALDALLKAEETRIADGFVPNRRAIRPLVRFSASAEQWKLEFDRSGLHSGAVHYDPATDRLVLSGVPDYLKRMLAEED